jgi:hypothetical protein
MLPESALERGGAPPTGKIVSRVLENALRAGAPRTDAVVPVGADLFCAECRYGIVARPRLPRCPMCGAHAWLPRTLPMQKAEPEPVAA